MEKFEYVKYNFMKSFDNNIKVVGNDGIYGIYQNGVFLVPLVCDEIYVVRGIFYLSSNGKKGLFKNGVLVPIIYDKISEINSNLFIVTMNGKQGVYDLSEGCEIIPCEYMDIRFNNNYFIGSNFDKNVIFDSKGNKIYERECEHIGFSNVDKSYFTIKDGKYRNIYDSKRNKEMEIGDDNWWIEKYELPDKSTLLIKESRNHNKIYYNSEFICEVNFPIRKFNVVNNYIYISSDLFDYLVDINEKKIVSYDARVMGNIIVMLDKENNKGMIHKGKSAVISGDDCSIHIDYNYGKVYFIDKNDELYFVDSDLNEGFVCDGCKTIKKFDENYIVIENVDNTKKFLDKRTKRVVKGELYNEICDISISVHSNKVNNISYYLENYILNDYKYRIVVGENGKKGLFDDKIMEEILPCEFEEIGFVIDGFVAYSYDGEYYGVVNIDTKEDILSPVFKEIIFVDSRYIAGVDDDNLVHIICIRNRDYFIKNKTEFKMLNYYGKYYIRHNDDCLDQFGSLYGVLPVITENESTVRTKKDRNTDNMGE